MAALRSRCGHYIFAVVSSFFFLYFFPRLISAVGYWMSTIGLLPHVVWQVSANLGCRSETCCTRLAANTGCTKSQSGHHRTILSGYIFAIKAHIDNRKPANFNGFRVLAALLHGTVVVGVSQTLRRWTEGSTYIRHGGNHVGHWPTFLVKFIFGQVKSVVSGSCVFKGYWFTPRNNKTGMLWALL